MKKPNNPKDQPSLFPAPTRAAEPSSSVSPQTALVGVWQSCEGAHGLGKGLRYARHAMVLAELHRRCDGRMENAEEAIRLFFSDCFRTGGSLNPDIGHFKRDLLRYAVRADRLLRTQALHKIETVEEASQRFTPAEAARVERIAPPEAKAAIERLKRAMRAPEPPPTPRP